jgi:multicomponent Na+:H+ antiporter subunit D
VVYLILVPIVMGVAIYYLPLRIARVCAVASQAGLLIWAATRLMAVRGSTTYLEIPGSDDHLVSIALQATWSPVLLTTVTIAVFTAVLLWSWRRPEFTSTYLLLMFVFQGLTTGIFLADDLFNLFVLFEVVTIVGVLLLLFDRATRSLYDALYYLTVHIVGMALFLMGVAQVYRAFGVLSFHEVERLIAAGDYDSHALVLPLAFLVAGLALKAALFPVMSWIPRCYANPGAPTGVLALMSGVVMSCALVWVVRIVGAFAPAANIRVPVMWWGIATVVVATIKAVSHTDLRVILAFSTMAFVGYTLAGAMISGAQNASITTSVAIHAVAKVALFLAAGSIAQRYGTWDIAEIRTAAGQRGVARQMPATALVSGAAVLALIGWPPSLAAVPTLVICGYAAVVFLPQRTTGTSGRLEELREPLRRSVSLPNAVLALTVLFAALLASGVMMGGGAA